MDLFTENIMRKTCHDCQITLEVFNYMQFKNPFSLSLSVSLSLCISIKTMTKDVHKNVSQGF